MGHRRKNAKKHYPKTKAHDKRKPEKYNNISPLQQKRSYMEIAYQASAGLAGIGAIVIGILLYYHKQTPAIWATFSTVVLVALAFSFFWQDKVWKADELKQKADTTPTNSITQPLDSKGNNAEQAKSVTQGLAPNRLESETIKGVKSMSDEKPKQSPSMKQEYINANTNIQAGRDVTIHNAPPPAPTTEGPRTITPEGETEMIRLLRPHAGKSLYLTEYNEPEVLRFSRQIQNIFITAGWEVATANVGMTNVNAYGLVCGVSNPDQPSAAAEAIRMAFKKVNISIPFEGMERMWPGSFASEAKQRGALFIIVGRKP